MVVGSKDEMRAFLRISIDLADELFVDSHCTVLQEDDGAVPVETTRQLSDDI